MKQKYVSGDLRVKATEIEFIMTTEVVDRDNDIIKVSGIKLDNFLKNPIMFYNHNSWESIGYWRNLRIENNTLVGTPEFSNTVLGEQVKTQVLDGSLRACSIGFMVLDQGQEQINDKMVNVIYQSELFECSIVTLPANQDAVRIKNNEIMQNILEGIMQEKEELLKAGSVLSNKNKTLIQTAYDALGEVLKVQEEDEDIKELKNEINTLKAEIKNLQDNKITLQQYLGTKND